MPEWLLTNGLGGFAAGTTDGINTRKYHGLLVAATLPPVGRIMTFSRFVENLVLDDRRIDFSAGIFGEDVVGQGQKFQRDFELGDGFVRWVFDIEGVRVERRVLVCHEVNASGVRYTVTRPGDHKGNVTLGLWPMLALRDFHGVRRRHDGPAPEIDAVEDRAVFIRSGDLAVRIEADGGRFRQAPDWWYGQTYPQETARAMDDREDHFTPGPFEVECSSEVTTIALWIHLDHDEGGFIWEQELERRQVALGATASCGGEAVLRAAAPPRPLTPAQRKLARAAADFVVHRHRPDGGLGTTVIAGYPWFADWGRDTFICVPGLFLAMGRIEEAGQVLATFADHVSQGMVPNRFDDYTNEPEYNTVDASLWFIHAAHAFRDAGGDGRVFSDRLLPACREIIDGYTRGTRFRIGVDESDGLVTAGDETTQLTWMDARRDGVVFTPRHGKAVEINALWYNALMLLGEERRAQQVRESFRARFIAIDPERLFEQGLHDVIGPDKPDRSVRPNQIFAVSLPHSPLDHEEQYVVVEVVRRKLLTPYGLRTLSADDPRYQPRFAGPMFERDRAYHNGTVWPWLIGPFLDAWLKVHHRSDAAVEQACHWLGPLLEHLERDACLNSISEVFDAEPPHRPGACFAQAWSVAEVLRLVIELEI